MHNLQNKASHYVTLPLRYVTVQYMTDSHVLSKSIHESMHKQKRKFMYEQIPKNVTYVMYVMYVMYCM